MKGSTCPFPQFSLPQRNKPITLTLSSGGNDACIVLPDVDIMQVAPQVVMGSFMNSGQVCIATKRIYIHESIYEPFVQAMVAVTQTLKVGNPSEEGVMVGPVQNKMQYDRVKGFFEDSKAKGYKFATGASDVPDGKGYFIAPTIIDNPPNDSRIIQEEPFGACCFRLRLRLPTLSLHTRILLPLSSLTFHTPPPLQPVRCQLTRPRQNL